MAGLAGSRFPDSLPVNTQPENRMTRQAHVNKNKFMKDILRKQQQYFNSHTTKPLAFRIEQLKKLRTALIRYEQELTQAIYRDFQKGDFNTFLTEFAGLHVELNKAIKEIKRWARVKRVGTNKLNMPAGSYIMPEPLGVCLIISSWNYPVNLTMGPVIGAIAAGNTMIVKPSELAPQTGSILARLVAEYFDPSYFTIVEGGIEEGTALLALPFDKIFFTGSVGVGKIVYQAAAKNLTPVTLELGGKSPLVVAADANLAVCVKRLVWGKFINAGQTCIAPDYVMVDKSIEKPFLDLLQKEITQGHYSLANQNYAQIINEKHFDRLIRLIEPEKVFTGGQFDRASRYLAPTVLINVSPEDKIMEDEIFGPILPVLTYEDINHAITFIKSKPKPLAFYLFSENRSLRDKLWREISFGGGMVNDVLLHFAHDQLPFGGVGQSGTGSYHGEAGFRTFSHYKSFLQKPSWFEFPIKYYPYSGWKLALIKRLIGL